MDYSRTFKLLFLLLVMGFFAQAQPVTASLLMKVEGFSHPESVVHDAINDVLYVSNIGENEDGDGFISKVSLTGEILDRNWIGGLNDPKGLLIVEDTLWVTDNTDLVMMQISAGAVSNRYEVQGSSFLNDITIDEEGNIYFSDSGNSSIYKRNLSGEITEWVKTEDLEYPNGLLVVDDAIYIAAWGGGEAGGNVLKIDLESMEIESVSRSPIGNLDGIQHIDNMNFYISDWATGKIFHIAGDGEVQEILTSERSAGDILFLQQKDQLVLPMNLQNAVWWYQLR